MAHLSEWEAVFSRGDLLTASLSYAPGAVVIGDVEREVAALEKAGVLHAVDILGAENSLATEKTVGEERETVARTARRLNREGDGAGSGDIRAGTAGVEWPPAVRV